MNEQHKHEKWDYLADLILDDIEDPQELLSAIHDLLNEHGTQEKEIERLANRLRQVECAECGETLLICKCEWEGE